MRKGRERGRHKDEENEEERGETIGHTQYRNYNTRSKFLSDSVL